MKKLIVVYLAVILFQSVFISCKIAEDNGNTQNLQETKEVINKNEIETEPLELPIIYSNTDYGFEFALPESWEGYSIIEDTWEGYYTGTDIEYDNRETVSGPEIFIRHPLWSEEEPRLDIPIMIFTLSQWEKVEKDELVAWAAVRPSEFGRNYEYVFGLPGRYNFSYATGWEEVQDIIASGAFSAAE